MKNKNLLSLLDTIAQQPETGENAAEFENLGQELATKLKGGQAQGDGEIDEYATFNGSCTVTNTGCK